MNKIVYQLSIAGLLHDIGKLLQRSEIWAWSEMESYETYCPDRRQIHSAGESRCTHRHVAYTARFLEEHLAHLVPAGEGDDHLIGWAARHHKPSTAMDHLIVQGDRLSAGMDRAADSEDEPAKYTGWPGVVKRRLTPILARITGERSENRFTDLILPMIEMSNCHSSMFPIKADLSKSAATSEYQRLALNFLEASKVYLAPEHSIEQLEATLLSLMERFTVTVPASTQETVCDVSLYDHSRTAAAFATALYLELISTEGKITEALVTDRATERFALVVADVSGIQRFLQAVPSKGAAKSLRGRSYWLQLLTDALARRLLQELSLPATNLIYAAGGKIWVLAPATAAVALARGSWPEEIDLWLANSTGSSLGFSVGLASFTPGDIFDGHAGELWESATENLVRQRYQRLRQKAEHEAAFCERGVVVSSETAVFAVRPFDGCDQVCRACGAELHSSTQTDEEPVCELCDRAQRLGSDLVTAEYVSRALSHDSNADLAFPAPVSVSYRLHSERPRNLRDAHLMSLPRMEKDGAFFQLPEPPTNTARYSVGVLLFARNCPRSGDKISTYEQLAQLRSSGHPRLGVLRADVDNLGQIFKTGLGKEATLSRIAALSRALSSFFSGYVSELIAGKSARIIDDYSDAVQVVYAGGDDLFLIGTWDRLPSLALHIRNELRECAAKNPMLSLSAGIAVASPSWPLIQLARAAGDLEHAAKRFRHHQGGRATHTKDAIAMFSAEHAAAWSEFRIAAGLCAELTSLVGSEPGAGLREFVRNKAVHHLPRSLLHRIAALSRDARTAKYGPQSTSDVLDQVQRDRWRWLQVYMFSRLAERHATAQGPIEMLQETLASEFFAVDGQPPIDGERQIIEYAELAALWALELTRC